MAKKKKQKQITKIEKAKKFFARVYAFFFPDDTKLKIECKTEVFRDADGKMHIRRSFYTFRSLYTFILWTAFVNPYKRAKEELKNLQKRPEYAFRLAGMTAMFLFIALGDFKNMSNMVLVGGAIAFDATQNKTATDGTDPITWSHTTSGSNRTLAVTIGSIRDDTSASYNGVSMTQGVHNFYGSSNNVTIYYLGDPATGANTVSVDMASNGNGYSTYCSISFSGSNSSSPLGATNSVGHASSLTSESLSITTTYDNSILVDSFYCSPAYTGTTWDAYTGQTQRHWMTFINDNGQGGASTKATTTAGSYTMRWDKSAGATPFRTAIAILEIRELGAVSVTVSATVVSATFSIPASTVTGGATVSPSVQVITASIPSYTIEAIRNNTETPSVQALTFSIPAYSVSGDSNVAVNTQVATFSIPAYFVEAGNVLITPSAQVLTFSIPAYGVDVVANIDVTPSAQSLTFSIPSYSVSVDANITITPSAQVLTASIPTYTIAVEANVSVSPSVQAMTFSIPSYSPSGSAIASPSAQSLTFSIPSYTISNIANITISQGVFSLSLSIPTFGITADYWQNKFDPITTNWSDKY